jgi:hypothetical protein
MDFVTCSEDFIVCRSVVILSCVISTTVEHILGFPTLCSKTALLIATNIAWTYLGTFHKIANLTISFVMSVCPSTSMEQFGLH